jgi:sigma-B regulation protein RsbQ
MGNPEVPILERELAASFCKTDPRVASAVARATFLGDYRDDVSRLTVPAAVIQSSTDVIAPTTVGEWMHQAIADSSLTTLRASGHCPHLSAPTETTEAVWRALAR